VEFGLAHAISIVSSAHCISLRHGSLRWVAFKIPTHNPPTHPTCGGCGGGGLIVFDSSMVLFFPIGSSQAV